MKKSLGLWDRSWSPMGNLPWSCQLMSLLWASAQEKWGPIGPREVGTYWHFVGDDSSLCWTLQEVWCPIPQSQNAIESALSVWWQQTSPHISKWPYGMGAALEFLRPQLSIWKMGQIGSWELGGPLEWPQELPGAGRRSSECLCPAQTKALLKFIQSITDLQNKLFREKSVAKKSVKTIALDQRLLNDNPKPNRLCKHILFGMEFWDSWSSYLKIWIVSFQTKTK
jgi:hypothetical protein